MASVNIKDIAKMCGVGVSTVSRAINNHPDVNPETRELIMRVIQENHYVPNNSARNLKRTDAAAIALLVKGISNSFFSEMIGVIQNETKRRKYTIVLQRVEFDEDEVDVALELVKEKRLRGIIFLGGYFVHSEEKLHELEVPFVLATTGSITEAYSRNTYSSVTVDDFAESYKMTNYLIGLGHRRIVLIGSKPTDVSVGRLRYEGYVKALKENGIEPDDDLVVPMDPELEDYSMENGYSVMQKFLSTGRKCTAVFAISDTLAIGAARAIHDAGMSIPADISIAGFDGIKAGMYYSPSITTIRQPVEEMSKAAIKILFDIIDGDGIHRHDIFPGELIIRESTAELK